MGIIQLRLKLKRLPSYFRDYFSKQWRRVYSLVDSENNWVAKGKYKIYYYITVLVLLAIIIFIVYSRK